MMLHTPNLLTLIIITLFSLLLTATHALPQSPTPSKTTSPSSSSSSLSTTTSAPGSDRGAPPWAAGAGAGGPPAWIGSAIAQYQASLHNTAANSTSSSSSATPITAAAATSGSSTSSTSTATAAATSPPGNGSAQSESGGGSVGKDKGRDFKKDFVIVAAVTGVWLSIGAGVWWFLRRRKRRRSAATQAEEAEKGGGTPVTEVGEGAGTEMGVEGIGGIDVGGGERCEVSAGGEGVHWRGGGGGELDGMGRVELKGEGGRSELG